MMGNPVMFVVEIGSVITTALLFKGGAAFKFNLQITLWLWFTVLFANIAEAMAEGRGKAQADTLRKARSETVANRLVGDHGAVEKIPSSKLKAGDLVLVSAGEFIPSDGEIIEGVASVDESAITGESAPVIREAGGDRSAVTGGTRVLSDQIKVKITSNPGETFLDRMIALVEGAARPGVYKEVFAVDERGPHPKIKVAGDKSTWPGIKEVYRLGQFASDVIQLADEPKPPGSERLLKPVVLGGEVVPGSLPPLSEIWEFAQSNLRRLPDDYRQLVNPKPYAVRISPGICKLRDLAIAEQQALSTNSRVQE